MSRTTDSILDREAKGELVWNDDQQAYEEVKQILKGKSEKVLTPRHEQAVRRIHEHELKAFNE